MKIKTLLSITFLFLNSLLSHGQSWSLINSPTTEDIRSCSFLDENLGWIISYNAIYKTTDGGITWTSQNYPPTPPNIWRTFSSVQFINENVGIIACGNVLYPNHDPNLVSTILWTSDGGTTWIYKDLGSYSTFDKSAILVTPLIAYSIASYSNCKKTTDGGLTWTQVSFSGNSYSGNNLFALDQDNIYFAGMHNLHLTAAIGKFYSASGMWGVTSVPTEVAFYDIFFINASKGWIVGTDGTIKMTSNGGQNWSDQNSTITSAIRGVSFKNELEGWAVSVDGKIIKTINGGNTWTQEYNVGTFLGDITFKNLNGYGYAVGNGGKILKYDSNLQVNKFKSNYFSIYPNPTNNNVCINSVDIGSKIVTIELINAVGQSIKKIEYNNDSPIWINIENFNDGFYYFKITNDNNITEVKKIIKI